MRYLLSLWFVLQVVVICSCSSTSKTDAQAKIVPQYETSWPSILKTGSHGQIRDAGKTDARVDIASGNPQICYTGTIVAFPVGVPKKYFDEIRKLPRVPLPCGCTEPLVGAATIYAKAYNAEIVSYLESKQN
jgi:hypothetical protein